MDFSQYFGFVWAGIILTFRYLSMRKILEYRTRSIANRAKVQVAQGKNASNPLSNFQSFGEMAAQGETLLDEQVKKIAAECTKNGKNPMEDVGYNTVLKQYQTALAWRTRLESPMGRFVDSIAFPFAKDLSGSAIKRLMEVIQNV